MIGLRLSHPKSGTVGTVDAESVQPDASVHVRINDKWFDARYLVAA